MNWLMVAGGAAGVCLGREKKVGGESRWTKAKGNENSMEASTGKVIWLASDGTTHLAEVIVTVMS